MNRLPQAPSLKGCVCKGDCCSQHAGKYGNQMSLPPQDEYADITSFRKTFQSRVTQGYDLDEQGWNTLYTLRQKMCNLDSLEQNNKEQETPYHSCMCIPDYGDSPVLKKASEIIDYVPESEFLKKMKQQCEYLQNCQPNIFSTIDQFNPAPVSNQTFNVGLDSRPNARQATPQIKQCSCKSGKETKKNGLDKVDMAYKSPENRRPSTQGGKETKRNGLDRVDMAYRSPENCRPSTQGGSRERLKEKQFSGEPKKVNNKKSEHISRSKVPVKCKRRRTRKSNSSEKCESVEQFEPTLKRPHENSCERCWRYASPSRSPVNKPDQRYNPNFRRAHSCVEFEKGDGDVETPTDSNLKGVSVKDKRVAAQPAQCQSKSPSPTPSPPATPASRPKTPKTPSPPGSPVPKQDTTFGSYATPKSPSFQLPSRPCHRSPPPSPIPKEPTFESFPVTPRPKSAFGSLPPCSKPKSPFVDSPTTPIVPQGGSGGGGSGAIYQTSFPYGSFEQPAPLAFSRQQTPPVCSRQPSPNVCSRQPTPNVCQRKPAVTLYSQQPVFSGYPRQPAPNAYPQQPAFNASPRQPSSTVYPQQPVFNGCPRQPSPTVYSQQPGPSVYPQQPAFNACPRQPSPSVYPQQPGPSVYPKQPAFNACPRQPSPTVYPQQPGPSVYPQQPAFNACPRQPTSPIYPQQPGSTPPSPQSFERTFGKKLNFDESCGMSSRDNDSNMTVAKTNPLNITDKSFTPELSVEILRDNDTIEDFFNQSDYKEFLGLQSPEKNPNLTAGTVYQSIKLSEHSCAVSDSALGRPRSRASRDPRLETVLEVDTKSLESSKAKTPSASQKFPKKSSNKGRPQTAGPCLGSGPPQCAKSCSPKRPASGKSVKGKPSSPKSQKSRGSPKSPKKSPAKAKSPTPNENNTRTECPVASRPPTEKKEKAATTVLTLDDLSFPNFEESLIEQYVSPHPLIKDCDCPPRVPPDRNDPNVTLSHVFCCHCNWEENLKNNPNRASHDHFSGNAKLMSCECKKTDDSSGEIERTMKCPYKDFDEMYSLISEKEKDERESELEKAKRELEEAKRKAENLQNMLSPQPGPSGLCRKYFVYHMTTAKERNGKGAEDVEVLVEELTQSSKGKDSRAKDITEKMRKIMEPPSDSLALRFQKGVPDSFRTPASSRVLYF